MHLSGNPHREQATVPRSTLRGMASFHFLTNLSGRFRWKERGMTLGFSRNMPRSRYSVLMIVLPYSDTNSRA